MVTPKSNGLLKAIWFNPLKSDGSRTVAEVWCFDMLKSEGQNKIGKSSEIIFFENK